MFKKNRFKDRLQIGTWTLNLKGKHDESVKTLSLTDNSQIILDTDIVVGDAGRRFDIITGSAGIAADGYTGINDRFGRSNNSSAPK